MTSWYSGLLTTTTSRISNLRSTLLQGEADGDTEDDTHVCRVLRAYYTEKGRAFPPWLPPDPKAPPPAAPVYASNPQVGARYGQPAGAGAGPGPAGGLSSLWDSGPAGGRPGAAPHHQQQQQAAAAAAGSRNPFARGGAGEAAREEVHARPLPSQRAGSYQQAYGRDGSGGAPPPPPPPPGGGSAQDRLKQRLWGGAKTTSPAQAAPFQPPPPRSSGGGSGGHGSYEDRFAPGGGGTYDAPQMGANAPWTSGGEGAYGGGGGGGRAGGLPSGPRRMGGLPSGPRMR